MDISLLMDFIPIRYNLKGPIIFGVTGISMGGHSSLLAMAREKRLTFCASLIGCGNYAKLSTTRRGFMAQEHYKEALHKVVCLNDPICNLSGFEHKYLYMSQGAEDTLVPAFCNKEFVDEIKKINLSDLVYTIFPNTKHEVTEIMYQDVIQWITSVLSKQQQKL
jgi:dipeptidyl aminopeptidase/acylaminoacyl peptidase